MRVTARIAVIAAAAAGVVAVSASPAGADPEPQAGSLSSIANANAKAPGMAPANLLSRQLAEISRAQGSTRLENPNQQVTSYYGYHNDGTMLPQIPGSTSEATKSEPDKNTYLVFDDSLPGADPQHHYGTHFLFQGHELAPGYITRINLDADDAHRVTLLATTDTSGAPLPAFDGSTWDPFAHKLLFSEENGNSGGIWEANVGTVPAHVRNLQPFIGRGGFEGMQNDSDGNLWIVEDVGGSTGTGANSTAKRPNSYVYRFVPNDRDDLTQGGRIQALQVLDSSGNPITWGTSLSNDQAAFTAQVQALHTCGNTFDTRWVTLATTSAGASLPGPDDNALARAAGATPFKRPENGQFRPGTGFGQFFFDETGDTNATSTANAGFGGWATIQRLAQSSPSANTGKLKVFYTGDQAHAGIDNVAFFDRDHISFVEDAGDTLHLQRGAFDSAYMFDVTRSYCAGLNPVRWLALGRDPSATIDSLLMGTTGFQNEGDNEITGLHVSDGDPSVDGLLGARIPHAWDDGWRVFFTQQHGDNHTWEVVPAVIDGD